MTQESLVGIIVLLFGSHWASVVYRLHKAENELLEMRKDFSIATIAVANAAVVAAQATASAANAAVSATMRKP